MLTQEQRKYLKERLANATYARRKKAEKASATKDTPAVKAARALIKRFDATEYERQRKARAMVDKEAAKVRESLLFAAASDALKAIKTFESK